MKQTRIQPLGNRLVVNKEETINHMTEGGIYIPDETVDKAKEKSRFGTVLAIGDLVKNVNIGDVVIFGQFSGVAIKDYGEDVHIIKQEDIHGKYVG
jgi:chaperonin GroES